MLVNKRQDELLQIQRDHSGIDTTTTQLKLEVQKLREEVLLSQDLCDSRQKKLDSLLEEQKSYASKLEEVYVFCVMAMMCRGPSTSWS